MKIKKDIVEKNGFIVGAVFVGLVYMLVNVYTHFILVPLKTFFLDDIALFLQIKDGKFGFWRYVLTQHDSKLRPVSNAFLYLGYKLFKNNTNNAWLYIIVLGTIVSVGIYIIIYRICENNRTFIAILGGLLFAFSRFAYYTVGQYLGVMELVALICALITLYEGLKYINDESANEKKQFIRLNITTILTVLSHERYIVLYAFLFFCIWVKKKINKESVKEYIVVLFNACIILGLRFVFLGGHAMEGTGGTSVINMLDPIRICKFFVEGVLLLLGWNAGEPYLNGIAINKVPIFFNIIPFLVFILVLRAFMIVIKQNKNRKKEIVKTICVIIVFIFLTLLAGCITIRLELRWVYTPYIAYLCGILYIMSIIEFKNICQNSKIKKVEIVCIVVGAVSCVGIMESYFRSNWKNNYLGQEYAKYNNVYDITVEKYGKENICGKTIVLIENVDNGVEVINVDTLKRIYDYYVGSDNVSLYYLNDIRDIPENIDVNNSIFIYGEQSGDNIWKKEFYDVSYLYKIQKGF